jgi:glycosyltransferase involved in cell wall biosynthesis
MRKGQNPAKRDVPAYKPEKLGIATLVSIPFQEGYYANSWEIFRYHLASVHQYTNEPFNYLVFDNGSCPEVKRELEKLHEAGWIDWLVLSKQNLGKTGALNTILAGMPNKWICYIDSDMLVRSGWLEACRQIDGSFPGVGMIGAQVIFPDREVDKGNTKFRQTADPRYRLEQVKPEDWIVEEYCRARGVSEERQKFYEQMLLDQATCLETGVKAILGGNSHQQFLARREVLREVLPLPATFQLSRQEDTYQDAELDRRGYLHLTTTRPYLYHMGNAVDEELKPELARLNLPEAQVKLAAQNDKAGQKSSLAWKGLVWLSKSPRGRKTLARLYDNLYRILS